MHTTHVDTMWDKVRGPCSPKTAFAGHGSNNVYGLSNGFFRAAEAEVQKIQLFFWFQFHAKFVIFQRPSSAYTDSNRIFPGQRADCLQQTRLTQVTLGNLAL